MMMIMMIIIHLAVSNSVFCLISFIYVLSDFLP